MKVTPRKDEVAQMVEVLDQDHASIQDAAKAALKAAAEILSMRDLYLVAYRPTGVSRVFAYGPFSSPSEADRAFAKGLGIGGDYQVVTLRSAILQGWRAEGQAGKPWKGFCAHCLHLEGDHLWATSGPARRDRCGHNVNMLEDHLRCYCPGYKRVA